MQPQSTAVVTPRAPAFMRLADREARCAVRNLGICPVCLQCVSSRLRGSNTTLGWTAGGSELERRYYGQMKKSLSHLPREEQLRILVSLGPAHAWRLPPGHASQQ